MHRRGRRPVHDGPVKLGSAAPAAQGPCRSGSAPHPDRDEPVPSTIDDPGALEAIRPFCAAVPDPYVAGGGR